MDNVSVRASRIRNSLNARGSLTLWEVRAILNESRDNAFQVLFWMASRKEIAYRLQDRRLCVTLPVPGKVEGKPWRGSLRAGAGA